MTAKTHTHKTLSTPCAGNPWLRNNISVKNFARLLT